MRGRRPGSAARAAAFAALLVAGPGAVAQDSFAGAPFSAEGAPGAGGTVATPGAAAPGGAVRPAEAGRDAAAAGFRPGGAGGARDQTGAGGPDFTRIEAVETTDFGVPARDALHAGPMHGATPVSLPGGRTVTTRELHGLLSSGAPALVFDVLGGPQGLPNAIPAAPASQPGGFDDAVQRELGAWLGQVTNGRADLPMVFYCQSVECWMSWNAALRAVRLGYRNVLWYRGGIEAWQAAGLPLTGLGGW